MKELLVASLVSLLFYGCKKDAPEAGLPEATHTGANTAGCLINGQVFVATGFGSGLGKVAGIGGGFAYDSAFYLRLNGKFGDREGSLHLFLNSVPDYKKQLLLGPYNLNRNTPCMPAASPRQCSNYAAFFPNDNRQEVYLTDAQYTGVVNLTYVDITNVTIKRIASGAFEFIAVSNLDPMKTIHVTNGRFDRKQP